MAEVTILPPSHVATVATGNQQTQSATNTHAQPASLAPGSLVSGTIAGRDSNGNFLLKSPQGTFTLQSSTPLTYNSDVTIRVGANTAGATSARIVTVNGEPYAEFSAAEPETADSLSSALLAQAPQTGGEAGSNTATGVRAVVLSPPAEQTAPASIPSGSFVLLKLDPSAPAVQVSDDTSQAQTNTAPQAASIAAAASEATVPQQTASSSQPAALQQPAVSAPAPAFVSTATIAAASATTTPVETELSPGQTVTQTGNTSAAQSQAQQQTPAAASQPVPAQANPQAQASSTPVNTLYTAYTKQAPGSVAANTAITPAPSATAATNVSENSVAGTTYPAQILHADENGNVSLQTPLGVLTVKVPASQGFASLPTGTGLTLELIGAEAEQTATLSEPATLNELASSWQSLKDILNATVADDMQSSTALLARLPQLGETFIAESMAFISSLVQGDARKLLGDDTVETLKQNGHADLLERFSAEVTNLSTSFNMGAAKQLSGWQTLFMPFVFQETLQQARIYVKRDTPKKDRNSKAAGDTRFVVEVDLSELGPMQMDGLVRKKDAATAFDLVIRTHHGLTPENQSEILAIYNSAAELTGFKGSLAFQVTRDFPVKPLETLESNEVHSITV